MGEDWFNRKKRKFHGIRQNSFTLKSLKECGQTGGLGVSGVYSWNFEIMMLITLKTPLQTFIRLSIPVECSVTPWGNWSFIYKMNKVRSVYENSQSGFGNISCQFLVGIGW